MSNENGPAKKLHERINRPQGLEEQGLEEQGLEKPYPEAITWEDFFMGIAILSKKRPGQYNRNAKLIVRF